MARFPWLISLRQLLIGRPLPTSAHHEERYGNAEALAILSSVACTTQEIVLMLGMAGAAALSYTLPITVLIVGLMVIVGTSYRQTIRAYPQGGGSYRVSDWDPSRGWWTVFVTRHRWENLLHNQSTILLRTALRAQGTRVVTTVGFDL